MSSSGYVKGNVLRRPSVVRRSWGVSPTGTAEPNPTSPAGGIKPRINNGATGHLWLRTKQCLDRSTNGVLVLTAPTLLPPDKLVSSLQEASNILRTATCRIILGPSLLFQNVSSVESLRQDFISLQKKKETKKILAHI